MICAISPTGSQLDICTWVLFAAPLSTLTGPQSADGGREVLFFTFRSPEAGSISSLFPIHHDGIRVLQHWGRGEGGRRGSLPAPLGWVEMHFPQLEAGPGGGGHASPSSCEQAPPGPFLFLFNSSLCWDRIHILQKKLFLFSIFKSH